MNALPFLTIIIVMSVITFFLVKKREKKFSESMIRGKELNDLYEYQYFLSAAQQIKNQLLTKLSAINYDNIQYETFFSPFEITILKNQISSNIEELEEMILKQSISDEDFRFKADQLDKRIDLLSLPLAAMQHKLGDDYKENRIVA